MILKDIVLQTTLELLIPFDEYEYCLESICSKDDDHSLFNEEYCEEIEFDNDKCASRIKEIESLDTHLPWIPE